MNQTPPRKKLLIFDFDGTIADTYRLMIEVNNELAGPFGFRKISPKDIAAIQGKSAKDVVRYLKMPLWKVPQIAAQARRRVSEKIHTLKAVSGLKEALMKLKDAGIRLSIVSSNSKSNILTFLNHNNLEMFDAVETTSRIWGKNVTIGQLMKRNGFQREEVLYVGDEVRDIIAAQKLGLAVAAVTWGYNSKDILLRHKPDFIVDKPEELVGLLGN